MYLLAPPASSLQKGTTKFRQDYIGPLVINSVRFHALQSEISQRRVLLEIFHTNRLKVDVKTQQQLNKAIQGMNIPNLHSNTKSIQ